MTGIPRTDSGNAERFVAKYHDRLRFVGEANHWIQWTGTRWERDRLGRAQNTAHELTRDMYIAAWELQDKQEREEASKWALRSQSAGAIRSMVELARTTPKMTVSQGDLDRKPFLLACANGVVDLETGRLRAADPADLITRGSPVAYSPDAPRPERFERFLDELFDGDRDLIGWLQRFVGYALTGDTREHVLAVFYGSGCNGKSTLLTVLRDLLGDLAATSPFDTFAQTRNDDGPRNDLARLAGARLVSASETGNGRRLDEACVKQVTGADTITARFLYQEHFEFEPTFKIVLSTNHRPRVVGDDAGIWRRLRLVPFEQSFLGREDRTLNDDLRGELPGVLRWAVQGCLAWQEHGLGTAAAVTAATDDYRAGEDVLGGFLEACCGADGHVPVAHLRGAYEAWCQREGEESLRARAFSEAVLRRPGVESARTSSARIYRGIHLLEAPPLAAEG